ncbi:MAG: ribonuclease P protein component [Dehalococcoidia bacterium]|nr:ribonuclease P protein component [Dehalococcoidia bacterium]
MARPDSLRTRGQFGATLRSGRRERRTLITLVGQPTDLARTRVGYAVGKRVGGAVVRNRVRRRLRELMRHHLHLLEAGAGHPGPTWDIVVTAQPAVAAASFADLGAEVASALRALALHRARHRGAQRPRTGRAASDGGARR